jgi:hypothetical protein
MAHLTDIRLRLDLGLEGRFDLLLEQLFPVDAPEERMLLDLVRVLGTQTLGRVARKQLAGSNSQFEPFTASPSIVK